MTRVFSVLLNPPVLASTTEYFKTTLSTCGVLLGLAFAALLYVIQNGLSSFRFSRSMFIEYYALFGRFLLAILSYLVVLSLQQLYFGHRVINTLMFYAFCLAFLKLYLDVQKHLGYMRTLNSSKFVPQGFGSLRSYFRYIRNLGLAGLVRIIVVLSVFLVYPAYLSFQDSGSLAVTSKALFYSSLTVLMYSIYRIVAFIPEFFTFTQVEFQSRLSSPIDQENAQDTYGVDFKKEKIILREHFLAFGYSEFDPANEKVLRGGTLRSELLITDKPEAWVNIYMDDPEGNVESVRDSALEYSFKLAESYLESKVDIATIVLSMHITIPDATTLRNLFFRATRDELQSLKTDVKFSPNNALLNLKNKVVDDLFRW